ncbi:hypothetical protein DRN63_04090 [Nanoarchaeota archaeon]|nr:MAG: hypothetical protein DRN63_04090 [Nanoarchaeota archaeon]
MSDDRGLTLMLMIFMLGLVIGFLLGLVAITILRKEEELGYVFERDEKGLIVGVYAVPKPKK